MDTVARVLLYSGLLVIIGDVCTTRIADGAWGERTSAFNARTLLLSWLAVLIALLVLFVAQFLALELAPTTTDIALLVRQTAWGQGWSVLAAIALTGALSAAFSAPLAWRALVAVAIAVAMSGLGHAAADESPLVGRTLDAMHVLAMGAWLGTLVGVATGAAHQLTNDEPTVWPRFSRLATIAAPLTVLTGVGSAFRRVWSASLAEILASDYGRLLLLKAVIVLVMLALGAWHRKSVSRSHIPVVWGVRLEVLLAVIVLFATAVLTGSPPPGEA